MEASLSPEVWIVEDLGEQKLPARQLAAEMERSGRSVRLVDLRQEPAALVAEAKRVQPERIIFSVLFASRVDEQLALATALRDAGVRAHLAMMGHLPSMVPTELLAACPALDSAGLGEVDQFLFSKRDPEIPTFHGYGFATLQASRGCYRHCTFCLPAASYRRAGVPYQVRQLSDLMDEIESLYRRGVRFFLFDDEQFLPPTGSRMERVVAFTKELDARDLRIAFTCKCRAGDVEPELFRALKAHGLLRVYVGIESGDPATLELFGKGVTPRQNAEALARLSEMGIVADFRSLLFHPWSTLEIIETEIHFLQEVLPNVATLYDFQEVQIYPGTPLARRLLDEDRASGPPWSIRYTAIDPRAELLRRASRLIFGAASGYEDLRNRFKDDWFAVLLDNYFQPSSRAAEQGHKLRRLARMANQHVLKVWQEMLMFARECDIYNAQEVNTRVGSWIAEIRSINVD